MGAYTKQQSNEFKKYVMTLYKEGYHPITIAYILSDIYNVDPESPGRAFINFRARIRNCISRNKNKELKTTT